MLIALGLGLLPLLLDAKQTLLEPQKPTWIEDSVTPEEQILANSQEKSPMPPPTDQPADAVKQMVDGAKALNEMEVSRTIYVNIASEGDRVAANQIIARLRSIKFDGGRANVLGPTYQTSSPTSTQVRCFSKMSCANASICVWADSPSTLNSLR